MTKSTIYSNPLVHGATLGSDFLGKTALILCFLMAALPGAAKDKDIQYGMGLIVNVPFPESQVEQVVQDIVQNGIIRGTKEYNKDEYVSDATPATSTRAFPKWTEGGKVFYKVRLKALDPRNFKNGNDVGTLAVRYVVQPQGDKNTVLRIDAIFVEDFRHVSHASNGSVESAEYKDIHDRLDQLDLMKAQTAEAEKEKQQQAAARLNKTTVTMDDTVSSSSSSTTIHPEPAAAQPSAPAAAEAAVPVEATNTPVETLDERVQNLRRQVERLVKQPGAALKSAPFHTATTLQSLSGGTEVLIVISTPYWFGVETHDGQHGWMLRDDLELVP